MNFKSHQLIRSRSLFLLTCLLALLSGCTPSNRFTGRFLIVNNSGEDLSMIYLKVCDLEIEHAQTANGQAWITDLGNLYITGPLEMSWQTAAGETCQASIPIQKLVPDRCNDDLVIEIVGNGLMKMHHSRQVE